jgi:hypothetical protein
MKIDIKDPAFWVGIIVTTLSAFGLINAEEGAGLSTYSLGIATGVIGLWKLIPAIIKRHKDEKKAVGGGEDKAA